MSRKIAFRFATYFFVFYTALVLATTAIIILLFVEVLTDFNAYSDIKDADLWDIEEHISEDANGNHVLSEELIQIAQKSGGILQLIDENGKVIVTSDSAHQIPTEYSFTDLVNMATEERFYLWSLEQDIFLLFTKQTASDLLLEQLMTDDNFPDLTSEQKELLKEHHASLELYNADGTIITGINNKAKENLPILELLESSQILVEQEELRTAYVLDDGTIAIIRAPNPDYEFIDPTLKNFLVNLLIAFAVFHGILFLFIIGFSIWIGQRFGRPIFYFLKKIEKLSEKDYGYVEDRKLRHAKTGKLKRKYRMYDPVDHSLITLAKSLEDNELKIKKTEQLREDWITGLSHDLKTPLSSIYGYAMMLNSNHEWTSKEVQNFASVMQEKAGYMDELINDLTYTYQLKNNGITLDTQQIELQTYILEYVKRNGIKNIHLPNLDGTIYVSIDPKRFTRVIDNIIKNAISYNPENTPIHITISLDKDAALLKIRDEGIGMSPEVVENLFDRYYRGINTTSDNTGTGLGLTISKQLVEAHGGRIDVKSSSQGTTITIKLPLIELTKDH